jgi:hypothetical protein
VVRDSTTAQPSHLTRRPPPAVVEGDRRLPTAASGRFVSSALLDFPTAARLCILLLCGDSFGPDSGYGADSWFGGMLF